MNVWTRTTTYYLVATAMLWAFAVSAYANPRTWHVAVTGTDSGTCGAPAHPCRSIRQAVLNASAGDTVRVHPGTYTAFGDEGFCLCALLINKPVTVLSSSGAAATVIDGLDSTALQNVVLVTGNAGGGALGTPGHGFTVTGTAALFTVAIGIDSTNVTIAGNQVVGPQVYSGETEGIRAIGDGTILIQGNQVMGWGIGIIAFGTNTTVSQNVATLNRVGIDALGTSAVLGNVVTGGRPHPISGSTVGIILVDEARALGNDVRGYPGPPPSGGIETISPNVRIHRNNLVGNGCGVLNNAPPGVRAQNNYWGAATGPGPFPADDVCTAFATTTPFATTPFTVTPITP